MHIAIIQRDINTRDPVIKLDKVYDIVFMPCLEYKPLVQPEPRYLLYSDCSSITIYSRRGVERRVPCGSLAYVDGLLVKTYCVDGFPWSLDSERHVDIVYVAGRLYTTPMDGLREARRLIYRLMVLSAVYEAPVVFANIAGVDGHRVYVGYSGVYDYRISLPVHLGGLGDGFTIYRFKHAELRELHDV